MLSESIVFHRRCSSDLALVVVVFLFQGILKTSMNLRFHCVCNFFLGETLRLHHYLALWYDFTLTCDESSSLF